MGLRGRTSVGANIWWSRDSGAGAQLNHPSPSGFILLFCSCVLAAHSALHLILYFRFVLGSIVGSIINLSSMQVFYMNSVVKVGILNKSSNTLCWVYRVVLVKENFLVVQFIWTPVFGSTFSFWGQSSVGDLYLCLFSLYCCCDCCNYLSCKLAYCKFLWVKRNVKSTLWCCDAGD